MIFLGFMRFLRSFPGGFSRFALWGKGFRMSGAAARTGCLRE